MSPYTGKRTLLVIDDVPDNLIVMNEILHEQYKVRGANTGLKGIEIARKEPQPDLILLDIMMPELDGFEVCQRLKMDPLTADIPIIFVTASTERVDEEKGLNLGAVDFLMKPVSPSIVKARIRTHLALKDAADYLKDKNVYLQQEVSRRTAEIQAQAEQLNTLQDVTINALASLAETRDNETGGHIRRTQTYIKLLAQRLWFNPAFKNIITSEYIDQLYKTAPLHDIGKVGIPDNILLKPGKLTPEEFETMKQHTTIGKAAIEHAESQQGTQLKFLEIAKEIALYHHERWDGQGYPEGLAGEQIPLSARLMSVADVYDAMISKRVYKPAMTHEHAVALICEGRGTQFDPVIVDAFLEIEADFKSIASDYPH